MKAYLCTVYAHRDQGTVAQTRSTALLMLAQNHDEAIGKAYAAADQKWPKDDDWQHDAKASEVTAEQLRKFLAALESESGSHNR